MIKEAAMQKLSKEIDQCKRCSLYKTRKNAVTGDGDVNSKILIIGEAPGKTENEEKKAFAGKAGQVLDNLLQSISLQRDDIYITNIIKCKPFPNNTPSALEINKCHPFLIRQLNIIQPKIIFSLGSFASKEICKIIDLPFTKISLMHGKLFEKNTQFGPIKVFPFYHPAAALYNPKILPILKRDFKKSSSLI
jgi:uracil-DNA glycosylase